MNVTDWTAAGYIATGDSYLFHDPWLSVLVDDEFEDDAAGIYRRAMLNWNISRPSMADAARDIATVYWLRKNVVRVKA
jgi:hypothetical protein